MLVGCIARRVRATAAAARVAGRARTANLRRPLASQAAAANAAPPAGEDVDEALRSALAFDYAKGLPFVSDLDDAWFSGRAAFPRPLPMFRLLDPEVPGALAAGAEERAATAAADEFLCRRMYETMVTLQALDDVFYHAQRQGRMSFYMQAAGEEAATVCSAAGLEPDDEVFGQYREQGCLLWRGFGLQAMADQCIGNVDSLDKGRVMPIHYGSKALRFQTISSPLATQIPHATGAALAVKLAKEDRVVACYFGEGAASEGDAHPALNFAATLRVPALFIVRNNGYAISTPSDEQFAGDGIAPRALALGMDAIRVDGNDALATLMTYRLSHHSTSDDASKYRGADELKALSVRARHPVDRLRAYMAERGHWDDDDEASARADTRAEVRAALDAAEAKDKPHVDTLFDDVYDELTPELEKQKAALNAWMAAKGE
ncbi:alpha-ketoacid dehydrogenase [Aureococcus anophagefferens]|nr:alpha-ketoacid dehydrogenase [Aureococcus anophagefferens]